MRKIAVDRKLLTGFGALIFLVIVIGLIGVSQIQYLSNTVAKLGGRYLPMQRATLEMKNNNSLYAMAIRNYIFWKTSKYLEAASSASNAGMIQNSSDAFERNLLDYASLIQADKERELVKKISDYRIELRLTGSRIMKLADEIEQATDNVGKKESESSLNRLLMIFENKFFKIDDFLSNTVQKYNLDLINDQLLRANLVKQKAVWMLFTSLALAVLIGLATAFVVYKNTERESHRRQQVVRRMIKLEEEQRGNLSMQVHDQMGQDLSALKIYLGLIEKNCSPGEFDKIKKQTEEGKKILTGLISKAHNISELLRPSALDEIGLVDTIDSLISQYKQMSGLNFVYLKPKFNLELSSENSLALYRVAQEGLTNILKHAQAKNVKIELGLKGMMCQLIIEDDGVGFDYIQFLKERKKLSKLGLMGLEERMELLGGKMEIKTSAGKGTRLVVLLPISKT